MSESGRQRSTPNAYTNGRNRRGGRGGGGGGVGGRGRGRGGGGGGRGRGKGSQDNYIWTAGGAAGPSYPVATWTAGGGADNNSSNNNNNSFNNVPPQFEDLDYSREAKSGLIFGLKEDVIVPGSVDQALLQGEILETLKRMPSDIVNLMLAQYDTCAREGGIRNKNAYLLGIINSGPRMGLPQGVVVPPSVKFSLMQGVVLDDLNALEVPEINLMLGEFDKEMRARGSNIYDKYSFLADIIRKHKPATPKRNRNIHHQYVVGTPATGDGRTPSALRIIDPQILSTMNNVKLENGEIVPDVPIQTSDEMEDTLALLANSMDRIQMLTESLGKVRGELVAEREKRNSQEAIARSEQILREATEERLETTLKELDEERAARLREQQEYQTALKYENDRRKATEQEIKELRERVDIERAEKHRAEDRLSVLEEVLISERDVRDQERGDGTELPEFNSTEFDSDGEH